MSESTKFYAPSVVGVDAVVRDCVAKRIIARFGGITSAAGLITALQELQRKAESDPYLIGPGESYAGIALELSCDPDDGQYEIEFRADP